MASEFKECPKCGATMGSWIGRCDCGHIFGAADEETKSKKTAARKEGPGVLRRFGPWLAFGILITWGVTRESELDKLQRRVADLESSCADDDDLKKIETRVEALESRTGGRR